MARSDDHDRMGLETKPVQVRLSPEAYDALVLLASLENKHYGEKGGEILTVALLGCAHGAKVAALHYARSQAADSERQDTLNRGRGRGQP